MSILGGFETTSTAPFWFSFYMPKYSDIQQKIKNELKKHNLIDGTQLTQDILDLLIYHRACIGEDLAFFELKIAIVRLMQRISFEDPGDAANNSDGYVQRITCFPKHLAVRVRIDTDKNFD
ncbi:unnamed protein product [Adineta steineri]|uniref:Uncharacterized protein n=1 Tax=Adineta steineri TaxID=433720 RepID=A0A819YNN7_9BILA|nr:unnamed protein product [Adineta steineri]CAF4161078.1 unnamed protein product [Adineta steineri]